jgi:vacuolar-type H+-ATPase subunit H
MRDPLTDEFVKPKVAVQEDGLGPAAWLLVREIYYTDEELVNAQRARVKELETLADKLDGQVLNARARLGELVLQVRARSEESEKELVAALVPWAHKESAAIVRDAQRRAAELNNRGDAPPDVSDIGTLLAEHLELQERLLHMVTEMALGGLELDLRT